MLPADKAPRASFQQGEQEGESHHVALWWCHAKLTVTWSDSSVGNLVSSLTHGFNTQVLDLKKKKMFCA